VRLAVAGLCSVAGILGGPVAVYPAVIVSGWFGGAATGLLSTVLCAAGLAARVWPLSAADLQDVAIFVGNGILISGVCHHLRETRDMFAAVACRKDELQALNSRLYQDARRASRAKDEFLAVLSHELRTPLNAIVGWTHMLRGGRLAPEMSGRALEIIERNAKVASQLLADMLDMSRIVSGKLNVERRAIDLRAVVQTTVDSARWLAEEKGVHLVGPAPGPPLRVSGDAERLQQVAGNLLANALKFTPSGGRAVVTVGEEGANAVVVVEDNGVGIAPDLLPHVFERYRQGDSSLSRQHRGLGLGLAIARHVVEMHGGVVEAASDGPNRGARFTVRMPLLASASGELADVAEGELVRG
jgi:signal transduction histidine kinase